MGAQFLHLARQGGDSHHCPPVSYATGFTHVFPRTRSAGAYRLHFNGVNQGVSNSNCSESQIRTYKVTRGPHYDDDATMVVSELERKKLLHLFPAKSVVSNRQIVSSSHYVHLKELFARGQAFVIRHLKEIRKK